MAEQTETTEYTFNDKERAFFATHLEELNKRVLAVNTAADLVVKQQGFEGRWMLRPDGSGLVKQEQAEAPANV